MFLYGLKIKNTNEPYQITAEGFPKSKREKFKRSRVPKDSGAIVKQKMAKIGFQSISISDIYNI